MKDGWDGDGGSAGHKVNYGRGGGSGGCGDRSRIDGISAGDDDPALPRGNIEFIIFFFPEIW